MVLMPTDSKFIKGYYLKQNSVPMSTFENLIHTNTCTNSHIFILSSGSVGAASVVLWSEFLTTNPEVPGSIPSAFRFSEKQRVWNGVHSAS
jgi:hypothetical protein